MNAEAHSVICKLIGKLKIVDLSEKVKKKKKTVYNINIINARLFLLTMTYVCFIYVFIK